MRARPASIDVRRAPISCAIGGCAAWPATILLARSRMCPMMSFDLDDFLHYFDSVRQRTRRVAALIPADRIEWACKPGAFTLGDLVRHIGVAERFIWAETVHDRKAAYTTHGPELADGRD